MLYPVYALLFAETGLSTAEISSLFAIWSVTAFVLEVPSGIWADAISRRLVLVVAPVLAAAGWALWVLLPSYPAFAVGFVLWGAQGALQSGALEALVYEELDFLGAAERYPSLIGRATALGTVAAATATGLAAPVLAAGGFTALGIVSAAAGVAAAGVAAALPEHRPHRGDRVARARPGDHYRDVLRAGVAEVRARPAVRVALVLVPAVTAVWGSLDEYLPLLASEAGATTTAVPLLALLVYAGMAAGGLAGASVSALAPRGLAGVLVLASSALAAGALARTPAGFVAIAVSFAAFQALTVAADARLQAAIDGPARATITSLAGFVTEVLVLAVFAGYALGSLAGDHATLFAVFAALQLPVAVWIARRRGARQGEPEPAPARRA